eukprot:397587_1
MLHVLLNNPKARKHKYGKIAIEYLSNRKNIGDWITLWCLGRVIHKPTIEFLKSGWNRRVEFMEITGENKSKGEEMLYSLLYLVSTFDPKILKQAIELRKMFYILPERIKCARKVAASGNINVCKTHTKNGLSCECHKPTFKGRFAKDKNIKDIIPLLHADLLSE